MRSKLFCGLLLCALSFYNCSVEELIKPADAVEELPDTEEPDLTDPAAILAAEREITIKTIASTNGKIWRINSAVLTNPSGSFDISSNINVRDDELVFCKDISISGRVLTEFEGSLEWRKGNEIEVMAENAQGTLLDFYVSPNTYTYDFIEESSTELASIGAGLEFKLNANNEIEGIISFIGGANMVISLVPKLASDYKTAPAGTLEFTEAFTFQSNNIDGSAPGMVGSYSDNSIFLVTREDAFANEIGLPERIIKYSLDNSTVTEKLYFKSDFVSKQLHIINNQLKVVGGQRVNTYDLDLLNEPTSSANYGISLSRFGSAVIDSEIIVVGGDLNEQFGDKIFKWEEATSNLTEIATLPEPRYGARAEIVNDKLYVFGGTAALLTLPSKNTIYIYDLKTGNIKIESLSRALSYTYTGKFENLIFVAGQEEVEALGFRDRDPFLGVYSTYTGEFTELLTNLSSPELETIHSMAVFNGKLFIIYGQVQPVAEGELQTWSVLSADL